MDIRARVGIAKAAFWQNKELMRRNIRFKTKLKILNCYVFAVLNYGWKGLDLGQGEAQESKCL